MNINYLGRCISIVNQKGGVGKTTLTILLALELAHQGYKVVVVDNDAQGSVTYKLFGDETLPMSITAGHEPRGVAATLKLYKEHNGNILDVVRPEPVDGGFDLIGTDAQLVEVNSSVNMDGAGIFAENIEKLSTHYDYIIIDSGPTLGVTWTASVLGGLSGTFIPVLYDSLSVQAMDQAFTRISRINKFSVLKAYPLGIVPMRTRRNVLVEKPQIKEVARLAEINKIPVLCGIPDYVKVVEAVELNIALSQHAAKTKSNSSLQLTIKQMISVIEKLEESA